MLKRPVHPVKFVVEATGIAHWLPVIVSPGQEVEEDDDEVEIEEDDAEEDADEEDAEEDAENATSRVWWWLCRNWCSRGPSDARRE